MTEKTNRLDIAEVKKVYKNNYSQILGLFMNVQSDFLSGIYNRYNKDLDAANIVLYFAKNLHQETLRERENDLEYDISFENFWNNHGKTRQKKLKIIEISEQTGLPKETTRRKVHNLVKTKTLLKDKNTISWLPAEIHKSSYNSIINQEVAQLARLIRFFSNQLNYNLSSEKISEDIKKNFSFYWFHYLNTELKYLRMWHNKLKDLELLLISIQCLIQANLSLQKKGAKVEGQGEIKERIDISQSTISATSISEITGIPRATCIRKLEKLYKLKFLKKDANSKRYYTDFKSSNNASLNSKETSEFTMDIFSEFLCLALRTLVK